MGRTVVSECGRFEWDELKSLSNKEDHGFYFEEILAVFDDPFFLEAYDDDNSTMDEVRWKGIASIDQRIYFFISYTDKNKRIRIISARLAEKLEKEKYDKNYKEQVSGFE